MADGYRVQHSANYFYPSIHHNRNIPRLPTPTRSLFSIDLPSPAQTPDPTSPQQTLYNMFGAGRNHQSGQYPRVNGNPPQQQPLHFPNNPYAHQQQTQPQHQQTLQQDHNNHSTNGSLAHHANYSAGLLSSSTPTFTPSQLSNGHSAVTRGGQALQITEHWAAQLTLHKECMNANKSMVHDNQTHHYARSKPQAQARILPAGDDDDSAEDIGRPSNWTRSIRRQDWKNVDMSGQGLKILSMPVFAYQFLVELYISSNSIRILPPAIGSLKNLGHLDVSNNELTTLPPELGRCVFLKQLLLFDNKISTLPNTLGYLYQLEMLGIEGNPLGAEYRNVIMEKGTKALIHQLRETITQEQESLNLEPNYREMVDLHEGSTPSAQESLKVLSYNTLCHKYATVSQYGYLPSGALDWEWRKQKVLEELRERDADILCLQEIDAHSYNEFFRSELSYDGYKGIFWPKSRARTMSEKDAKVVDGCAIFYKHEKYILLDKQLIDIANIAINRPDMKNQPDMFNRVMPKDHVGVIAFLENRATGSRLIVVNTHLEWNAAFADVKVIQTAILLDYVSKWAEKYVNWPPCKDKKSYVLQDESTSGVTQEVVEPAPSMEYSNYNQIPMVLCGDFNSLKDSGVYELLEQGQIEKDHVDLGAYKYGNFTRDGISHKFSLRSSYSHLNNTPKHIPFTNYTPGFVGIIDYIWYSNNTLECTKLLGPVSPEYLQRVPAFPSWHYPSDHLSLASEFVIKTSASKRKVVTQPDFGNNGRGHSRE